MMAEITLSDYTGYIFLEILRAREMADMHARSVAARYQQDEVLKHFSTPRFKIQKMQLNIPVLISGAKFTQVVRYAVAREDFRKQLGAHVLLFISTLQLDDNGLLRLTPATAADESASRVEKRQIARRWQASAAMQALFNQFHVDLQANPDPLRPENIVKINWAHIVELAIAEGGLAEIYRKRYSDNQLFNHSMADVLAWVRAGTVVSKTEINNLLVNPETNLIKNGSDDNSVFTITAELVEEGFYVRSVKDSETGTVRKVVEFD